MTANYTVNIHLPIHGKNLHFPVGGIATFTPVWPSTWLNWSKFFFRDRLIQQKSIIKTTRLWGPLVYSSYFHDRSKLQKFPSRYFSHKNPSNFGILFEFFVLLTGTKKQPKNHRRKNGFVNSAPYGWCHCHLAARNVEMIGSSGFLVLGGLGWPSKIEVIKGFQVNIYIYCISKQILSIYDMCIDMRSIFDIGSWNHVAGSTEN